MGIPDMIGPLGERIKNPLNPVNSDFAGGGPTKVLSTNNMDMGIDDDLAAQTLLNNKLNFMSSGGGSKLEYPLDVSGNPAYAATVKFQILEFTNPNEGESQKKHQSLSDDNLAATGTSSPKVEGDAGVDAFGDFPSVISTGDPYGNLSEFGGEGSDIETEKIIKAKKDEQSDTLNTLVSGLSNFKRDFYPKVGAPSVVMYFPMSQTFVDGMNYANTDLSAVGGTVEALGNAGAVSGVGKLISDIIDQGKSQMDLISADPGAAVLGAVQNEGARAAAARFLSKAPLGTGNAITLLNRMVINPNTRSLFGGVNLREFAFQFKLIATSPQEGEIIQKIIKIFRKEAYPESYRVPVGEEAEVALGFNFPNAFQITFNFKDAENLNMPKILPAYLRNISHTINPTGGSFRNDGKPNEIDLTLNFVEHKTIDAIDVERGY